MGKTICQNPFGPDNLISENRSDLGSSLAADTLNRILYKLRKTNGSFSVALLILRIRPGRVI